MRSKWTSDYATGETICAVCGAPRGTRTSCCPVAPFPGATIPYSTAREFYSDYSDYSLSACESLAEYIRQTTQEI